MLYRLKINIHDTERIEKSRSVLSSPALLLDRIKVFYSKFDSVLISPKNKSGFVENLLWVNEVIYVKPSPPPPQGGFTNLPYLRGKSWGEMLLPQAQSPQLQILKFSVHLLYV